MSIAGSGIYLEMHVSIRGVRNGFLLLHAFPKAEGHPARPPLEYVARNKSELLALIEELLPDGQPAT